ncbi:hypothetical protein EG329_002671 [Mollisiaceae sp. DMI_Dod_QoI]|nr:hypothetical protein EG329_002671 [Helotiales sp. DMI_Dod_QoI]
MADTMDLCKEAVDYIRSILPESFVLEIGIIGGSGLSGLDMALGGARLEVPYKDIKGFPVSTVDGHAGKLVFGYIGITNTPAVLMNGRAHYYEGHELSSATLPIRVLRLLGMNTLIVTNAAGGLNPEYQVGDIIVLNDHINLPGLAGIHPLRGPNLDFFGPRFLALSDAYDLKLRRVAYKAWAEGVGGASKMDEGVYAFVSGPTYETRAESRMLRALGADMVGMSTVPEVIVARHSNIRVLAMSLITNAVVVDPGPRGDDPTLAETGESELDEVLAEGKATHDEVLENSSLVAEKIKKLVIKIVEMEMSG